MIFLINLFLIKFLFKLQNFSSGSKNEFQNGKFQSLTKESSIGAGKNMFFLQSYK